jgi:hypothetical protein
VETQALTDFDGKLRGRLERIEDSVIEFDRYKSTHHVGLCSASYNIDIIRRLIPGMIFGVPNFKSDAQQRYTLFELVEFRPMHFGASAISTETLPDIRREIFERIRYEWFNESKVAYILLRGNPVNYDLVVSGEKYYFEEVWNYPLIGGELRFLTQDALVRFINADLPTDSPVVGKLIAQEDVDVKVNSSLLTEYHMGIFAYTGGGKSNLVSHLVRLIITNDSNTKVVIFDVAGEYAINLADLMSSSKIESLLILEETITDPQQLVSRFTIPKKFVYSDQFQVLGFANLLLQKKRVAKVSGSRVAFPYTVSKITYHDIGLLVTEKIDYYSEKGHNTGAKIMMQYSLKQLTDFLSEKGLDFDSQIGPEFREFVDKIGGSTAHKSVQMLATDLREILNLGLNQISYSDKVFSEGLTDSHIVSLLNSVEGPRLFILSFTDVSRLRRFMANLCSRALQYRKSRFTKHPSILFVFDEAQEMIPKDSKDEDGTRFSSYSVEQLLRQGRKYGLGGAIATQRLAYLNTNVLQQIHTYFVGTLPRPYDRTTISDQFALDPAIVDRTLSLRSGEWLLSSYEATGVRNTPIFIKAPNNESVISETLKSIRA